MLLAAGVLLLIYWLSGLRMPREPMAWVHFAVAAAVGNVVPFFLFGVGELSIDSGLAGVLNATIPLWTVTVALLIRTECAMSAAPVSGLLLGFAGMIVVFAGVGLVRRATATLPVSAAPSRRVFSPSHAQQSCPADME